MNVPDERGRPPGWKWVVCVLLLLASTINYMDRQTLANVSVRITEQFRLSEEQYGELELFFGWAFAVGSLAWGWLADRYPVRTLYPFVLGLWSLMGFLTAYAQGPGDLLACRTLLGFFEGGHWPCAVKTTQRLLEPSDRSMGNSVLQSGTSIGAILTPLFMRVLLTEEPGSWRFAFQIIGAIGVAWIVAWLLLIRRGDLSGEPRQAADRAGVGLASILFGRRMLVIIAVIALINTGWQILRAWLPRFLQRGRGYTEAEALGFNALFYLATDVGVFAAGAATLWLFRRGWEVHSARRLTFLACSLASAVSLLVLVLPKGPALLGALLVAGAGALGVFPIYHALTQDVSSRHQGKVSGIGGFAAWALSPAQKYYGRLVDQTGSYDLGFALAGCMPLLACVILWLGWGSHETENRRVEP